MSQEKGFEIELNNDIDKNGESPIKVVEGYRTRDEKTEGEYAEIIEEMERDNNGSEEIKGEKENKDIEELNDLKKEWSENGGFLPEDKQNRLYELEQAVYDRQKEGSYDGAEEAELDRLKKEY